MTVLIRIMDENGPDGPALRRALPSVGPSQAVPLLLLRNAQGMRARRPLGARR
jgi:hypothetical protein